MVVLGALVGCVAIDDLMSCFFFNVFFFHLFSPAF